MLLLLLLLAACAAHACDCSGEPHKQADPSLLLLPCVRAAEIARAKRGEEERKRKEKATYAKMFG